MGLMNREGLGMGLTNHGGSGNAIRYAFKYMLQRGQIEVRLTESANARSEQLLVMPREQLTN